MGTRAAFALSSSTMHRLLSLLTVVAVLFCGVIPHAHGAPPAQVWPGEKWDTATPAEVGLDEAKLIQARDYAVTGEGSGIIVRHGKVVMTWGDQAALYDIKSSSKSFGVTMLGLALKANVDYVPMDTSVNFDKALLEYLVQRQRRF